MVDSLSVSLARQPLHTHEYAVFDSDLEESLAALTSLAAHVCQTSIACISLIDEDHLMLKSHVGLKASEISQVRSFCLHTFLHTDLLMISDVRDDEQFSAVLLTRSAQFIRFYASVPLIDSEGMEMGFLSVIDRKPGILDKKQQTAVKHLSRQVVSQIELFRQIKYLSITNEKLNNTQADPQTIHEDLEHKVKQRTSWLAQMNAALQEELVERRCIQNEVTDSILFKEQIIANSPDCIKVLDLKGHLQWMSDSGAAMMELCDFKGLVGKKWVDMWPAEERDVVRDAIDAALMGTLQRFEGFFPTAKGTPKWWDVIVAPILGTEGKPESLIAISRDITDRHYSENALKVQTYRLRHADHCKVDALAKVTEELRTPLHLIQLKIDTLKNQLITNPQIVSGMNSIDTHMNKLNTLVNDLYDVSRLSYNTLELDCEDVSLGMVISSAIKYVAPVIKARAQNLSVDVKPAWLNADALRLSQAIGHILENAAKYTHRGGNINVFANFENQKCIIKIEDDGVGITAEMLERIFDPFVQSDITCSRIRGGLGVGLTIARNIIELHGGELNVKSAGPNLGSEFTVALPCLQIERKTIDTVGHDFLISQGQGLDSVCRHQQILIVNENSPIADSLAMLMLVMGCHVQTVHNENDAIQALYDNDVQIIFFDISRSGNIDRGMAYRIRDEFRNRCLHMVALINPGHSPASEIDEAGSNGLFDAYFTRPDSQEKLQEELVRVLEQF